MNNVQKIAVLAALIAASGVVALAGPAQAAQSYETTSAMSEVVRVQVPSERLSEAAEPNGIVGVGKALYAGFKAAGAPQRAGEVARLASVFGFAAGAPTESSDVEAAYFDR